MKRTAAAASLILVDLRTGEVALGSAERRGDVSGEIESRKSRLPLGLEEKQP